MTKRITLLALILVLSAASVLAQDTSNEWNRLNKEFMVLCQAKNYDRAQAVARVALAEAEKNAGQNNSSLVISLNNLAALYNMQGQYAEATPLFERAMAISEKSLDPNHPLVVASLKNVAGVYRKVGREKDAEALEQRIAAISTTTQSNPADVSFGQPKRSN
jgi:tetratricopeptide (TPR) repeat protein